MRIPVLFAALLMAGLSAPMGLPVQAQAPSDTITIHAARLFDGRGKTLTNATIEVRGARIVAVDQRKGPYTQDLGDVTLMPGLIDVHVHIDWHFQPNGLYGQRPGQTRETNDERDRAIDANARATLLAGFTTIQTLGSALDKPLRERIAAGATIGPRIHSSMGQLQAGTRTPEQLRALVRTYKANGADVIKTFASGSIRDGGTMSVMQEQLDAVCGEAKVQGLRALVHAHDSDSIVAAVKAGCSEIEHGVFADDRAIKAMKEANVFFDPNIGLVLQNYIENRAKYLGSGNYNDEGFAFMEKAVPTLGPIFAKALKAGLRMPMGTDAVAGAHGQNAREMVARVKAGQTPMDAIIGATSLAAESLRLGDTIGTLAPGFDADIIAVRGDPVKDITATQRVVMVMQGGVVRRGGL